MKQRRKEKNIHNLHYRFGKDDNYVLRLTGKRVWLDKCVAALDILQQSPTGLALMEQTASGFYYNGSKYRYPCFIKEWQEDNETLGIIIPPDNNYFTLYVANNCDKTPVLMEEFIFVLPHEMRHGMQYPDRYFMFTQTLATAPLFNVGKISQNQHKQDNFIDSLQYLGADEIDAQNYEIKIAFELAQINPEYKKLHSIACQRTESRIGRLEVFTETFAQTQGSYEDKIRKAMEAATKHYASKQIIYFSFRHEDLFDEDALLGNKPLNAQQKRFFTTKFDKLDLTANHRLMKNTSSLYLKNTFHLPAPSGYEHIFIPYNQDMHSLFDERILGPIAKTFKSTLDDYQQTNPAKGSRLSTTRRIPLAYLARREKLFDRTHQR